MRFFKNLIRGANRLEDALASTVLAAIVVLLPAEMAARAFDNAVPGALPGFLEPFLGGGPLAFVQHLTLWIGFLGAALAAKEGKLLAMATGTFLPAGRGTPKQRRTAERESGDWRTESEVRDDD